MRAIESYNKIISSSIKEIYFCDVNDTIVKESKLLRVNMDGKSRNFEYGSFFIDFIVIFIHLNFNAN